MSITPDMTTGERLYWSFVVHGTQVVGNFTGYLTKDGVDDSTSMEFVSVGNQRFAFRSVAGIGNPGIYGARLITADGANDIWLDDVSVGVEGVTTSKKIYTAPPVNKG